MGRNLLIRIISAFSVAAVLSSCAIWEDRTDCPCWLQLSADEEIFNSCDSLCLACWSDGELQFTDTLLKSEHNSFPFIYERPIRKGSIRVSYWRGSTTLTPGAESDTLLAGQSRNTFHGEFLKDTVVFHKQYMHLTVDFEKYEGAKDGSAVLTSDGGGFDVYDFRPDSAPFSHSMRRIPGAQYVFESCLLRHQQNSRIEMQFTDIVTGSVRWSFHLDEILTEIGYDWTAVDLPDVNIIVLGKDVTVSVDGWDDVTLFDFVY